MDSAERDAISSRISTSCPPSTQQILTAAWAHDLVKTKELIDAPEKASAQEPKTLETPLHAAIRACGPPSEEDTEAELAAAEAMVRELFLWGAIWNDLDDRGETPGCLAWRLGRIALYDLCVEAGVRAEMLFGLLDGYVELESEVEDDAEEDEEHDAVILDAASLRVNDVEDNRDDQEVQDGDEAPVLVSLASHREQATANLLAENKTRDARPDESTFESAIYLRSHLTYASDKLLDSANNAVMMDWETDIMRRSVSALLRDQQPGKRILNIGFGLGIIDGIFAETNPARHHIIEAHPEVLRHMAGPGSKLGPDWEARGSEPGAFKAYGGKWQDVCPQLLAEGQVYDAIYFDTFGEDYSQLRYFFTEFVPGLLDQEGVFSFFNGLGADRRICYDVYTKVVELHTVEAGINVEWQVIPVNMKQLSVEGEGEWTGVSRRYWTLNTYRLPVCTFMG